MKIPEGTQGCFAFVSHAGAQKDLAKSLVEAVESRGMKCWIAPRDIVPGMDYGEQIVLGIRGSEHLLLLFSEESNRSQFCQREVERAVHYRRKILPIRLDGTLPSGPMEFHLSSVQWMDGRAEKDVEVWVDRAIEVLRMPNAAQSPIPSDHKPFRFAGSDVWSPRELARELARNWKIGLSRDFRAMVIRWIEVETGEHSLALNLQDLEKQRLSEEERLSGMLVLMAPEEPLIWKGDTVTLADNGLNNAIALSGCTVDFNGKTATSSIAYTNGTLANATGYTGDVTFSGTKSFASAALGSARVIVATGTTLDFAAGFNNAVRNTGGAVTNGANYTGTMTYAGGQSINVTADQVAKLGFESGTTAKGSGTLTSLGFGAGSAYTMTIKNPTGAAGVGYDSVTVTGALNLATLSSTNRMTLNLVSLDASNTVGAALANQNFGWGNPQNFTLFTYGTLSLGNGVTNVADLFTVNYANFKDSYGASAQADWFTISNDSVNGAILLVAIPEPSTYGMSLAGLALALAAIRRRNKRKTDAAK